MPVYVLRRGKKRTEAVMTVAEYESAHMDDGRIRFEGLLWDRDFSASSVARTQKASCWPKVSDFIGCAPDQVQDMSRYLRDQGVPTEITPDGDCVLNSRKHQKKVLKALKMHNRNAGYSD